MLWIALQPLLEPLPAASASASASEPEGLKAGPADAGTLLALGWHALGFTPRVTLLEEAVLLEVSASLRLFGGLGRLLTKLLHSFFGAQSASALAACLRCAPGPTSLQALGRLRTGLTWRAAARLPPQALPLSCLSAALAHHGVLERVGCRNWGDLRALPRGGVARRFGQPLLTALDQAWGEQPENHVWISLPEVFDESLELPALVENASALMFAVNRLLLRLKSWLVAHGSGLLGLQLAWQLDPRRDVPPRGDLLIRLTEPTQDMIHVARLVAEHLARIRLPAPAHTLCLRSLETALLTNITRSLLPEEQLQGASLPQLVERLSARLGPQQVQCWQPQARHVPERMQRWVPAQVPAKGSAKGLTKGSADRPGAKGLTAARLLNSFKPSAPTGQCQPDPLLPSWLLPEPLALAVRGERPWYDGPLTLLVGPQRLEIAGWQGLSLAKSPHPSLPPKGEGAVRGQLRPDVLPGTGFAKSPHPGLPPEGEGAVRGQRRFDVLPGVGFAESPHSSFSRKGEGVVRGKGTLPLSAAEADSRANGLLLPPLGEGWDGGAQRAAQPQDQVQPVMRDFFIARSEKAGLLWIFRGRLEPGETGDAPGWYLHGIFA